MGSLKRISEVQELSRNATSLRDAQESSSTQRQKRHKRPLPCSMAPMWAVPHYTWTLGRASHECKLSFIVFLAQLRIMRFCEFLVLYSCITMGADLAIYLAPQKGLVNP